MSKESVKPVLSKMDVVGNQPLDRAIGQIADRMEAVLEDERAILSGASTGSLDAIVSRKNHLAVELTRLIGYAATADSNPGVRERLNQLRAELELNERLLRRHMDAIKEVIDIVAKTMNQSTDDGTYSSAIVHYGVKQ